MSICEKNANGHVSTKKKTETNLMKKNDVVSICERGFVWRKVKPHIVQIIAHFHIS